MTPEERREAQIKAASPDDIVGEAAKQRVIGILSLLAYFDGHEPAVADAIRYGLTPFQQKTGDVREPLFLHGHQAFYIDKPAES